MCIVSPCRYRGYQIVVVLVAGRPLWGAERVNFQTRRICAKRLTIILGRKYRSENYHQLENKYKALYTFGPVPILSRRCDTNCGEGEAGGVWWVWNKIASEKKKKIGARTKKTDYGTRKEECVGGTGTAFAETADGCRCGESKKRTKKFTTTVGKQKLRR